MLLDFLARISRRQPVGEHWVAAGGRRVAVRVIRHPRARRYVLRLGADGVAKLTIPKRGSVRDALDFANSQSLWLEKEWLRRQANPGGRQAWTSGHTVLFRGEPVLLATGADGKRSWVDLAGEIIHADDVSGDLRPLIEQHWFRLAGRELPPRVAELAAEKGIVFKRVSVRNQRTRWGSCSRRGTISLNWRLIQVPAWVRDYVILHELAHLREMNHSERFWTEVGGICPRFQEARLWLKQNAKVLR